MEEEENKNSGETVYLAPETVWLGPGLRLAVVSASVIERRIGRGGRWRPGFSLGKNGESDQEKGRVYVIKGHFSLKKKL